LLVHVLEVGGGVEGVVDGSSVDFRVHVLLAVVEVENWNQVLLGVYGTEFEGVSLLILFGHLCGINGYDYAIL
jgi:hypothetical protein